MALLLALAIPAFWIDVGPGTNQGIPQDLESTRALNVLGDAAGEGAIAPTEIVDRHGRGRRRRGSAVLDRGRRAPRAGPRGRPEVVSVVVAARAHRASIQTGRYLRLQSIGRERVRRSLPRWTSSIGFASEIVPAAGSRRASSVYAGGGPPSSVDFLDLTYGTFPWLVLAVLALTYVLLLRAFRSLLLPLKAIVLNLLSIGAAYGLLVVVLQVGRGRARSASRATTRSRAGSRSSCSRCCSASRWTTRCSSSAGCARNGIAARAERAARSRSGSRRRAGSSPPPA